MRSAVADLTMPESALQEKRDGGKVAIHHAAPPGPLAGALVKPVVSQQPTVLKASGARSRWSGDGSDLGDREGVLLTSAAGDAQRMPW